MGAEGWSAVAIDLMRNAETDWPAVGWRLPLGKCPSPAEPAAHSLLALALSASARYRERSTVPGHVSSLPEALDFCPAFQRNLGCPPLPPSHTPPTPPP